MPDVPKNNVTAKRILHMLTAQDFKCAISGRRLTPETASLDHIVPLSKGGAHDMSNLWLVDHRINLAKGTMTFEEFVEMCREVVAHTASGVRHRKPEGPMVPSEKTLF